MLISHKLSRRFIWKKINEKIRINLPNKIKNQLKSTNQPNRFNQKS